MSRIGKKPIEIPEGVSVTVLENQIEIKGIFGAFLKTIPSNLSIKIENKQIVLYRTDELKKSYELHGLYRALIQSMILGVSKKFTKELLAEGVGYKFQLNQNELFLTAGFTHQIKFLIPKELEIKVESPIKISIKGIDKELVGLFAAKIHEIKPPEPYKGKGIFYAGETILRKVGKRGK